MKEVVWACRGGCSKQPLWHAHTQSFSPAVGLALSSELAHLLCYKLKAVERSRYSLGSTEVLLPFG